MFKNIKRSIIINLSILILGISSSLYAATADISASSYDVTEGTAVSINVGINAATWNVHVSGRVSDSIVGYDENAENKNVSKSYNLDTSVAGTYTVSISGDVTDANGTNISVEKSVTVVVNKKEIPVPEEPTTPSQNPETNNNVNNNITTTTKSSNANLKNLVIDQEGLTPMFSSIVTNYSLKVPETVTSLKITPTVEQSGAKYWITGEDDLQMGRNVVTITVTAPDGTKKTYTINVDRVKDTTKADASLKTLIIDGVELSPEFTSENLEYNLGVFDSSVEKLTILAYANSDNAKVEIQGNDDFKEGENIIKIIVTAEDETTVQEYVLKFTKDAKTVEVVNNEEDFYQELYEEPTRWENIKNNVKKNKLLLILLAVTIIELVEILVLYKKLNSNKDKEHEDLDNFNSNYNINIDGLEEAQENAKKRRRANNSESQEKVDIEQPEAGYKEEGKIELKMPEEEKIELENSNENGEVETEKIKFDNETDNLVDEVVEESSKNLKEDKIEESHEKLDFDKIVDENSDATIEKKYENETIETSNETVPEIDFESLIKETLKKYEQEDSNEEKE